MACLGESEHTHMNGMNQLNAFMYKCKKTQLHTSAHSWDQCSESFGDGWPHPIEMNKFATSMLD